MAETLEAGDLTTALRAWLDGMDLDAHGDLNTEVRERLVTALAGAAPTAPVDTTTVLSQLLATRSVG